MHAASRPVEPDDVTEPAARAALAASDARRWGWLALLLCVLLLLGAPLASDVGLWEPHELRTAELSRRIAIQLHGASNLAIEHTDNSLPHLNDLGRPQLAFSSMALGLAAFGLHEWAGRLPLMLWAILGAMALYGALARLLHPRAGLYAVLVLGTTPLYFMQARTLLGDVVAMASLAMAWAGLAVAVLDEDCGARARLGWGTLGVLGLICGVFSRGALLGVAAPLYAVGLPWALMRTQQRGGRVVQQALGAAALLGALGVTAGGFFAATRLQPGDDLSHWLGALPVAPKQMPTFDVILAHIAHSCAPWSALVPFALGRLFWSLTDSDRGAAGLLEWRQAVVKSSLMLGLAAAVMLQGALAVYTDVTPFVGVALLAAVVAVCLFDLDRGADASYFLGIGVLLLAIVLQNDFVKLPEKFFQVFGLVSNNEMPKSLQSHSALIWRAVLLGFAAMVAICFAESASERACFDTKLYARRLRAIGAAYGGSVASVYFAVLFFVSLAALALWLGMRLQISLVWRVPVAVRERVQLLWWALSLLPGTLLLGAQLLLDLWQFLFSQAQPLGRSSLTRGLQPMVSLWRQIWRQDAPEKCDKGAEKDAQNESQNEQEQSAEYGIEQSAGDAQSEREHSRILAAASLLFLIGMVWAPVMLAFGEQRALGALAGLFAVPVAYAALGLLGDLLCGSRAAALALGGAALGLMLSLHWYPTVLGQLSPREVFASYRQARGGEDALALLGVRGGSVAYYAGRDPHRLRSAEAALQWLLQAPAGARRFIAVQRQQLAELNAVYRRAHGRNVPVLDGSLEQVQLVVSELHAKERDDNPLTRYVSDAPQIEVKSALATLNGGQLEVLGCEVFDERGRKVEVLRTQRNYTFKVYFKVLRDGLGEWDAFLHLDGPKRRYNGDHEPCAGNYPSKLWRKGDYITDEHEFMLEPKFGAGMYDARIGLFSGNQRMKVDGADAKSDHRTHCARLRVE